MTSASWSVGRSTSLPLWNVAPARTRATRWGAFTARHRDCAASMSLNAIARPAAREPGPLVTLVRESHGREGRFDGVGRSQMDPVVGRVVVELEQHIEVAGDLLDGLRKLGLIRESPASARALLGLHVLVAAWVR